MDSFFRFVIGFLTFICVSFGVTFAVNVYSNSQQTQQQTASAFEAMLGK